MSLLRNQLHPILKEYLISGYNAEVARSREVLLRGREFLVEDGARHRLRCHVDEHIVDVPIHGDSLLDGEDACLLDEGLEFLSEVLQSWVRDLREVGLLHRIVEVHMWTTFFLIHV